MKNQNDPTAQYYDSVYEGVKGPDVVAVEIELILSLIEPNAHILDLACGTGRHTIPLLENGYKITAIDSSEAMLKELKKKLGIKQTARYLRQTTDYSLKLINEDFFTHNFETAHFDLIIMMWNVFNEIALTENNAKQFLSKCKSLLEKRSGAYRAKILINIDNAYFIDPAHFSHKQWVRTKDRAYESIWNVKSFDQSTNTTVSEEIINEFDSTDTLLNSATAEITQRWWKIEEIQRICEGLDLTVEVRKVGVNEELYLVLEEKK